MVNKNDFLRIFFCKIIGRDGKNNVLQQRF